MGLDFSGHDENKQILLLLAEQFLLTSAVPSSKIVAGSLNSL